LVAYRFYSAFFAAKIFVLDDGRATPAEHLEDGRDFVPTNEWVLLGHHFAAIAGPGPASGSDAGGAVRLRAATPRMRSIFAASRTERNQEPRLQRRGRSRVLSSISISIRRRYSSVSRCC
jgi:hypothetical protein